MAYCPAHPPELVILSKVLPSIFFYILIVQFCLLPLTTPHLLVTSQPLYPTLFKVNSHNFISTFIRFWREGKTNKKTKKNNLVLSLYNFIHLLFTTLVHSTPLLLLSLTILPRVPSHYLLPTTPSPFLLHNSPYPFLYCPLTTPPASHSFTFFGVLPSRRAFECHHFEPLLE